MSLIKTINYDENKPFDGILNFLTKYTKEKDLHSSNHVHIFVSSNGTGSYRAKDLRYTIGYENEERNFYWISENIENSWYAIDFRGFKLKIDSYVYKATEADFFKRWELLGSNDNNTWIKLSESTTNFKNPTLNFTVLNEKCNENSKNNFFSLLKLKVYDKRTLNSKYKLAIYGLEFFGQIYSKYDVLTNCVKHIFVNKDSLFIYISYFCLLK